MNANNAKAVERIVKQANHMLNNTAYYCDTLAREAILSMAVGSLTALRAMGRERVSQATLAQETHHWVGFVPNGRGIYDLDSRNFTEAEEAEATHE